MSRWSAAWLRAALLWPYLLAAPAFAQDTAGTGSLVGRVVGSGGNAVAEVAVCVARVGLCDVSRADGGFNIDGLRPGAYQVEVVAPGQPPFLSEPLDIRAGVHARLEITLPEGARLEETVTVSAPAFLLPDEIKNSGFLVPARDILGAAGALQDVSRYVQTLPGVAIATDDFRNDLIVRGGSPLENLYIVDNIELPNINTFATFASSGGTVSMVDANVIRDVTFLTGGYPAPYGNRASSVMQITQREGDRTRIGGRATVGFAGAGLVLEGPLGSARAGSWIVSARRSFLDLFTDDVGIGGVPVTYTLNAKATYDLSGRDRLSFLNISGIDDLRLGLTEDADLTSELSTLDIRYGGSRSATGATWQRTFSRGVGLFGLTHSRARVDQQVNDLLRNGVPPPGTPVEEQLADGVLVFREDSIERETTLKYDLTVDVPALGKVQAGINARRFVVDYDAASPFGSDSPFFPVPDVNPFAVDERAQSYQFGAYAQDTRALSRRVNVTLGARADRYDYLDATTVSPRAGVDVSLTRNVSARASYGQYTQQPFALFLAAYPQNRSLKPFRADHYITGISYRPNAATRITGEAYYKRYRDYPTSSQIASLSLANVGDTFALRDVLFPMVSAGRGESKGIELLFERSDTGGKWFGQANLSVSQVVHAGLDGVFRAGAFDYPAVANATGLYRLSSRWDLSARLAYLAGRPYTPFDTESSSEQRRAVYDLQRVTAERLPDYFRLDLRIDRRFVVSRRPVTVFAGVQNVTNRRNVAGYSWDRRNNVETTLEQLGVFPILGLDWSF